VNISLDELSVSLLRGELKKAVSAAEKAERNAGG
jgi:hypothetical protein